MNYRRKWEIFHKRKIPTGYEIHHIDGNHSNNHIDNLECLTTREHYERHLSQGDHSIILFYSRLDITEEEKLENRKSITGANNSMFGVTREDVSERNKKSAGMKWYNNGFAEIRSFKHPDESWGEGWKEGRIPPKPETCEKMSKSKKGISPWNKGIKTGKNDLKWYNNGKQEILSDLFPSGDWQEGRIYRERPDARERMIKMNKTKSHVKGRKWYNDGFKSKMYFEHPGEGWKEGRL